MNMINKYFDFSLEKISNTFLTKIQYGGISVTFPTGKIKNYKGSKSGYIADIYLNNFNLFKKLLQKGSIGFAESYMDGDFKTDNLSNLLLFAKQNELSYLKKKQAKFFYDLFIKASHYLNKNTKQGSKKNISYHYDLGNDFYKHWLDRSMTYSSGIFENNNNDLEKAQINKYKGIVEPLRLNDKSKILEIGCGWGGFSTFVAKEYGTKVRAITISKQQFNFVAQKIFHEGLNEKIKVEMCDYRDIEDKYDNIVSIEMFEAVGKKYWKEFFEKIKNSLSSSGSATMQIITIDDSNAENYQKNPDFIQQYIFPGGVLPSKMQLKTLTNSIGLQFNEYKNFKLSYAQTLKIWNQQFQKSWDKIAKKGFSLRFKRMWEYYFSYCEASFVSGTTDVSQFLIKK